MPFIHGGMGNEKGIPLDAGNEGDVVGSRIGDNVPNPMCFEKRQENLNIPFVCKKWFFH